MRRADVHAGLQALRVARGWSRAQMAKAMRASLITVWRLEHPRWNRKVPLRVVMRACDVLDTHPADVLGWPVRNLATPRPSP